MYEVRFPSQLPSTGMRLESASVNVTKPLDLWSIIRGQISEMSRVMSGCTQKKKEKKSPLTSDMLVLTGPIVMISSSEFPWQPVSRSLNTIALR